MLLSHNTANAVDIASNANNSAKIYLLLSIVAIIAGLVIYFWRYRWNSKYNSYKGYFFTVLLIISVLFLEIAYTVGLNKGTSAEKIVKILSGTLQFFSLDAAYSEMAKSALCAFSGWSVNVFYVMFCIYTVVVPIAGGCFLLQLLCSLIPRVRLFFSMRKTKFVFSELNERSIVLAEDIARLSWEIKNKKTTCKAEGIDPTYERWLKSACIVFTDTYSDDTKEESSELLARAKRIGAICLKDDILERYFYTIYLWRFAWGVGKKSRKIQKIIYFLMDKKEENNIVTAVALLSDKRELWKRTIEGKIPHLCHTDNMEMYVFSSNEEAPTIVENAFLHNCEQYSKNGAGSERIVADCEEEIIVKVINEYRNLVYDEIFDDNELFNYLISDTQRNIDSEDSLVKQNFWYQWLAHKRKDDTGKNNSTLRVAILGGGRISKEFYKTVSWCGQMLASLVRKETKGRNWKIYPMVDVQISVLAENAKDFERLLRMEMPALLEGKKTRLYFRSTEFGIRSTTSNVNSEEFKEAFYASKALEANLVLVAFGNDETNLQAARWVDREIRLNREDCSPTTIYYVVENEDMRKVLEQEDKERFNTYSGDNTNRFHQCRLRVCGSIISRLKLQNVLMSQLERRGLQAERMHEGGCKDGKNYMSGYNRESSIASALHFFNKVFSLKIKYPEDGAQDAGFKEKDLKRIFADEKTVAACVNQLYFLEHQRWCAYMMTQGYRCFTADEFLCSAFNEEGFYMKEGRKNDVLRLHSCLLECGADYAPIDVLLESYAKNKCSESDFKAALEKKTSAEQMKLGAQLHQTKVVEIYKDALSSQIKKIREKVKESYGKKCYKTLTDWLGDVFPEDKIVQVDLPNGKTTMRCMDPLDKLSLIATLCSPNNIYHDYKSYDVKIVQNLYLDVLRQRLMQQLIAKQVPLKNDVLTLCKKWKGWEMVKATVRGADQCEISEDLEYDSVSWCEEFEAILLRKENIIPEEEKKKMSNEEFFVVSDKKHSAIFSISNQKAREFLLVEVPKSGTNCVGRIQKNEKEYFVHFFRKRNLKYKRLPQDKKGKAQFFAEVEIDCCLIPKKRKNLSEKSLLRLLKVKKEKKVA